MRRYRVFASQFDARCRSLHDPLESWADEIRQQHETSRERILNDLRAEYGAWDFERKVADFIAIGVFPFSVITYHNALFTQTRNAFVQGAYYPALLAACALGERTLNHLVLDLRRDFTDTPEYPDVAHQASFANWNLMIRTLAAWSVIDELVTLLFKRLAQIRHRAVHFNADAYPNMRADGLVAIECIRDIIEHQFGSFGRHRWYIPGTAGTSFVKAEFERDPFVRRFILPTAVYVGPFHTVRSGSDGSLQFIDWPPEHYGDRAISDEQFRDAFNDCKPSSRPPVEG